MIVVQVTAKSLVQSELPTLQIDSTRLTTHPSIQDKVYLRQLCQWDKFERDARMHFESQQFSENVLGYTGPEPESDISRKEVFLCGDESSVVGRFGQHVGHVMTTVFQNAESLHDVSFGDFKAQSTQKNLEKYPDIAVGQKGSLFFVGEAKTPWLHPLDGSIYSDKNGHPFRKLLGQICGYMNDLGLEYGFLTTYEQTIFLKREMHAKNSDALKHNLVLWHSPVIYHNTSSQIPEGATIYLDYRKKVSLRECFLYLVSLARQDLEQKNSDGDAKRK
ncbi:uncharacterized protein N7506_001469 [Penicillium brevicompactum]|uniref:uncharacterized protein n=1 Tax=Penicillium brevicompactum TaxID=5074 RepID=UPI00253FF403|nr:uncharacterized protein N7506_001469 [Penicillium brevicompactum]KAJ5348216.1 hypothetical protein N7506_001469 [Penicillium brevicompactum]